MVRAATRILAPLLGVLALALAAPAGASAFVFLQTPSRNIGCVGDATYLRCDIGQTTVPSPPRPRSCELDWGNAFSMGPRSRVRRVCHGDTARGAGPVLAYGRSRRIGPFLCSSARAGLTCRNRAGHGWLLSRTRIRLF